MQVDASTTGGGAVVRLGQDVYEYFALHWATASAEHLGVVPGISNFQSFWEALILVLALTVWGGKFTTESVAVLGDNTAALENSLHFKGLGTDGCGLSPELSWRVARFRWAFAVGHLPGEYNGVVDALSRLGQPHAPAYPARALRGATRVDAPDLCTFWKVR